MSVQTPKGQPMRLVVCENAMRKGSIRKRPISYFIAYRRSSATGSPSREVLVVLVGLHKNRGWRKRDRRRQWNRRWLFGVDCRKSGKTLIRCRESCPILLGRLANPIRAFAGTNQNHCSQSPGRGDLARDFSLWGPRYNERMSRNRPAD